MLRLYRLDPPGRRPDALTRGKLIHAALDDFVTATAAGPARRRRRGSSATPSRRRWRRTRPGRRSSAIWTARLARAAGWFLDGEAARRARGAPAAREVKGRREVEGLARPFAITARADRIDRVPGGYAIYDYKSGTNPSAAEARAFHLQLPLEAAIAAAGGFEGLPPGPGAAPRAPEVRPDRRDPARSTPTPRRSTPPGRASPR